MGKDRDHGLAWSAIGEIGEDRARYRGRSRGFEFGNDGAGIGEVLLTKRPGAGAFVRATSFIAPRCFSTEPGDAWTRRAHGSARLRQSVAPRQVQHEVASTAGAPGDCAGDVCLNEAIFVRSQIVLAWGPAFGTKGFLSRASEPAGRPARDRRKGGRADLRFDPPSYRAAVLRDCGHSDRNTAPPDAGVRIERRREDGEIEGFVRGGDIARWHRPPSQAIASSRPHTLDDRIGPNENGKRWPSSPKARKPAN